MYTSRSLAVGFVTVWSGVTLDGAPKSNFNNFFGLERRHSDNKFIGLLRNSQDVLISQHENVSNELVDFYKSLYSEDQHLTENERFDFLQKVSPPTISATEKQNVVINQ